MKIKLSALSLFFTFCYATGAFSGISGPGFRSTSQQPKTPKVEMKYGKAKSVQENTDIIQSQKTISEEGFVVKNSSPKQQLQYNCQEDNDIKFCVDADNKPVDGKVAQYDDLGTALSIENFKKGYLNGLSSYFYQDGNPKERLYYKDGQKNGMYKYYYPERNIQISANYKNGLLDGQLDVYLPNNSLYGRMKYKKGRLEKGYCKEGGKKVDFSRDLLKSYPFNVINTCGLPQ